jgi:LacI family transcriptional regulator
MPDNKTLRSQRTPVIGVIVHRLDSYFVTSALKGIEEAVAGSGYELIVTHSQESMEREVANARLLFDNQVDGVIASLSLETKGLGHFKAFTNEGVPIVFFDRVAETEGSDRVVIDNAGCGYLATEHLIRQGCKRIAILTSSLERNVYAQRYEGYRAALEKYEMPFTREWLILEDHDKEAGPDAAIQISRMRPMPDGLFITNDRAAAMCMHGLKEAGIRVPEDIAIVGFNNDPVCRLITPTLTTIDYPGYEMGRSAAISLLDRLAGGKTAVQSKTAIIPSGLIVRDSSMKAAHVLA